jgi:site-specific recombinase XerC
LAEIAEMHTVDVDVDLDVAMVLGKGRRERHPHATSEWLWLGLRGRRTASGLSQVVLRRGGRLACPGGCTRISSGTPARPAGRRQW